MVPGFNLQSIGNFIRPLLSKIHNMRLCSLSFRRRTLDLDFTIVNLNLDVKFFMQFTDIAASFSNKLVCVFLREGKGKGEPAFFVVFYFLCYEGANLLSKRFDSR